MHECTFIPFICDRSVENESMEVAEHDFLQTSPPQTSDRVQLSKKEMVNLQDENMPLI